jgi:hypothetical protein
MRMKSIAATIGCVAAIAGVGAGSAFAGEATGNFGTDHGNNSKTTPIASPGTVAQSICAFSGQNPERFLPPLLENGQPNPDYEAGRVQNWGHIPDRQSVPEFLHPGNSCNGHTGFLAGGGEEG